MAFLTLPERYAERARMSFLIEHGTDQERTTHLPYYQGLQDDFHTKSRAYAEAYARLGKPPPPALPWCNICGRDDRELVIGTLLCIVCAATLATAPDTGEERVCDTGAV